MSAGLFGRHLHIISVTLELAAFCNIKLLKPDISYGTYVIRGLSCNLRDFAVLFTLVTQLNMKDISVLSNQYLSVLSVDVQQSWYLLCFVWSNLMCYCVWMRTTCTPKIPKTMKKAQQISTMFPMGLREVIRVSTTSFNPGARLITLENTNSDMQMFLVPAQTQVVKIRSMKVSNPPNGYPISTRKQTAKPCTSVGVRFVAGVRLWGCPGSCFR